MPIKKAAFKHLRQTKKRTAKNLAIKRNLKSFVKLARKAIDSKDKAKAAEAVKKAAKALDKAAQHRVIKKNNASRKKSRLMRALGKLSGEKIVEENKTSK